MFPRQLYFKKKFKMWNFLLFINKILLLYNTFYIYVLHSLILKTFTSFLVFLTISKMVAVTISGHNLKLNDVIFSCTFLTSKGTLLDELYTCIVGVTEEQSQIPPSPLPPPPSSRSKKIKKFDLNRVYYEFRLVQF